jgi:serine/threonine protein kinase
MAGGEVLRSFREQVYPLLRGSLRLDRALADRSRPLPAVTRLRLAADVAAGLAYLHAPGGGLAPLPHCGLSSGNVLLDACDGPRGRQAARARISDLGLGFVRPPAPGYEDPAWASAADAAERGEASDVFALGVVLLELLTGLPAHDPERRPAALHARLHGSLPATAESTLSLADRSARWAELQVGRSPARFPDASMPSESRRPRRDFRARGS